jgi:trehalose-phosphatase
MIHLFEDWEAVRAQIQQARTLVLFLDYDGTLTPIVARPDLALCPANVKSLLKELRDCPKVMVAIISGRSLDDIRAKVGVSGITYVGNHGLEIENPAGIHRKRLSRAREKELHRIRGNLEEYLRPVSGILLEDKGSILTVHYRNTPPEESHRVPKLVDQVLERWGEHWQTFPGKMILEVRPRGDFNKGKTVQNFLRRVPSSGVLPIYLGDDRSDEDAFRALQGKGISIFVGPGSTHVAADYFLRGPSEVGEFLERCVEISKSYKRKSTSSAPRDS